MSFTNVFPPIQLITLTRLPRWTLQCQVEQEENQLMANQIEPANGRRRASRTAR